MNKMHALKLDKLLILLFVLFSTSVWAMDIKEAKSKGFVGEKQNGYIQAVDSSPSAEVSRLVGMVNKQRKAKYQKIADNNKISLSAVEARAGKVSVEKTASGQYVQKNGRWIKK